MTSTSNVTTPVPNPTASTVGFRVARFGPGMELQTNEDIVNYFAAQNPIANSETVCVEAYVDLNFANFTFATEESRSNDTYAYMIRPVPGLDFATLDADDPATYGTKGLEVVFNTDAPTIANSGIEFNGFRVRFTGVNTNASYALKLSTQYNAKYFSFIRNKIYVECFNAYAIDVGDNYSRLELRNNFVTFAANSPAALTRNAGIEIHEYMNTYKRLGLAGRVSINEGGGNKVGNSYSNMQMAAYESMNNSDFQCNVSDNAADTNIATVVDINTMFTSPSDARPKAGGSLIGVGAANDVGNLDLYGIVRTQPATAGAIQNPGKPANASKLVVIGSLNATVGYPATLRITTDNPLIDSQTLTLSLSNPSGFENGDADLVLSSDDQYEDIQFTFNTVGSQTITVHSTGSVNLPDLVFQVQVIAPIPASALLLTGDATVIAGNPAALSIKTNQPLIDAQAVSVAFSDGDNGVFSPNPAVLVAHSDTVSVTYTPSKTVSGNHTVTSVATGPLNLPNVTKVVAVTAAPPDYLEGQNIYHVGVGKQFPTWASMIAFLHGKDNVVQKANVIVYIDDDIVPTGTLSMNATVDYPTYILPAPGTGYADLEPGPQRYIPTTGRKLTFSSGDVYLPNGVNLEGFQLIFPTNAVLYVQTAYKYDNTGLSRNIINITAALTDASIRAGNALSNCVFNKNIVIKHGGSNRAINLGDSNASILHNTFYAVDGWTGDTILAVGSFGGKAAIQGNVAYNCGSMPISVPSGLTAALFKGNFSNVVPTGNTAAGFALINDPIFQSSTDLRPANGGPLIGMGSALVANTNDAYNKNYGYVPDAGAIQLASITPLPTATLKTFNGAIGNKVTILYDTTFNPTGGTVALTPINDPLVEGVYAAGVVTFLSDSIAQVVVDNISPGTYQLTGSVSNLGGPGAFTGTPIIKILGLGGTPVMPTNPVGGEVIVPKVTNLTVTPDSATISSGDTKQLIGIVEGDNSPSQLINWTVTGLNGANDGVVNSNGLFGPVVVTTQKKYVVRGTSAQDSSFYAESTITVNPVVVVDPGTPTVNSVTITPHSATVNDGSNLQLSVAVSISNGAASTVNWSKTGGGVLSSNGLFTAVGTSSVQTITVTATSTVNPAKSDTIIITVPALVVTGSPIYPPVANVTLGVNYGPTGVEYTGTYAPPENTGGGGGGTGATATEIADAVWSHLHALSVANFLLIK